MQYRTDKAGIIHATIGRASFNVDQLQTNGRSGRRPAKGSSRSCQGHYLRKLAVSSTMGGGARVEIASLSA